MAMDDYMMIQIVLMANMMMMMMMLMPKMLMTTVMPFMMTKILRSVNGIYCQSDLV